MQYYRRGFDPYVLDQNCRHNVQCVSGPFDVEGIPDRSVTTTQQRASRNARDVDNNEVTAFQHQHGIESCCCGYTRFPYTLQLFEKEEGEALEFFSTLYSWPDSKLARITALHPWRRVACRECRYKYENYAFMKRNTYSTDSVDDLLRENNAYIRQSDTNVFATSFYSGGVFDSERVHYKAFYVQRALASLSSQLQAEEAKYFIKNSSCEGYLPRFTFGTDIDKVFKKASNMRFSTNSRPPIGLNPERFAVQCKCKKWLIDCEFGVKYCELCREKAMAS